MQVNAGKGSALSTPKPSASIPGQWRFITAFIATPIGRSKQKADASRGVLLLFSLAFRKQAQCRKR
jgi:hypothetical protein